ncbi:GNAT family N-acetyltransferase [Candidatus Micrarchaeota archaeon]|nr:GNAT family N-acetyltransferase [Candidatus Micrarchaeota archaeon]
MNVEIREPRTEKEFEEYYDLRWRILRAPWGQPRGSERDGLENESIHLAAFAGKKIIGCGRIHFNSGEEAQIRYMAVDKRFQKKGVGRRILKELEKKAMKNGAKQIVLNARESAVGFYESRGYKIIGEAHKLFGVIPHFKMLKKP